MGMRRDLVMEADTTDNKYAGKIFYSKNIATGIVSTIVRRTVDLIKEDISAQIRNRFIYVADKERLETEN